MNTHKNNHTAFTQPNLVGNPQHRRFLQLQATYGITQRGGTQLPDFSDAQQARLVSDINLLDQAETQKLIFSEIIISN